MEEVRRDGSSKVKRSRTDSVSQAVLSYLQQRNYPLDITPGEYTPEEMTLSVLVDSASSRQNSILYSCFCSDPSVVNQNFVKFAAWTKETVRKHKLNDLEYLVPPVFCHLYLEILQRKHTEKAANFYKSHIGSVDKTKCDEQMQSLINLIGNNSDLEYILTELKRTLRCNKYVVELCTKSVELLRLFLAESCHVVMFQILQTWFSIQQIEPMPSTPPKTDSEAEEITELTEDVATMNGDCDSLDNLLDAIKAVQDEPAPLYHCHLSNLKDEVTSGVMSRLYGFAAYSYSSGVFVRSLRTLTRLDGADSDCDVVIRAHGGLIYDMDFIEKYKLLVTASYDRTARLFDLATYKEKFVYKGHNYPVYKVKSCSTGEYFVTGSSDYCARLWAVDRSETLRVCAGHKEAVTAVTFHPNSLYIITGSSDKTLRMWTISDGNTVRLLLGSEGTIFSAEFSPCGRYLATAGDDRYIRIWSLATGKQYTDIDTGGVLIDPIMKLAWIQTDSQQQLASASLDGIVRIYDMDSMLQTSPVETGQYTPISEVALRTKVLSLGWEYGTFGCLTAQAKTLMAYS